MPDTYHVKLSDGREFNVTTEGGAPSESDVLASLSSAPSATSPPPSTPAPSAKPDVHQMVAQLQTAWKGDAQKSTELAPMVGGLVGGAVAGVPGAIAGGMAGERLRQYQHAASGEAPLPSATDAVKNMAVQGGMQGAGQALGGAAVAGGTAISKWLMNRATTRVTAQLAREFPDLSDTLIDNALTVSKGGYEKAKGLLAAAKAPAVAALKQADAAGTTIPIELNHELADTLKTALIEQATKAGRIPAMPGAPVTAITSRLDPATRALIADIDAAAASGSPLKLSPSQADLFKTQLQRESRALYLNRVAVNGPRAMPAEAAVKADYAANLNDAIDAVASGYKAANKEAQPLIGAVRGLKQAIRPNGNLLQAMVRPGMGALLGGAAGNAEGGTPGAIAGSIAGAALTSPAGMSREAILLAHPAMQAILRQMPKPVAQALAEFLSTQLAGPSPSPAAAPASPGSK